MNVYLGTMSHVDKTFEHSISVYAAYIYSVTYSDEKSVPNVFFTE